MTISEGVVSGGVTIEVDAISNRRVKQVNKRLKKEFKELHKDMVKEVKKQGKVL
jgi:hypothetical protein